MISYIRALELDDYHRLVEWRNDPEITDLLGGNRFYVSSEREKKWVVNAIDNDSKHLHLAICLQENNIMVGLVNLSNIDLLNRKAEFSIMIGCKEAHGKGIGEAATKLILTHAFDFLNLNKVYLYVINENKRAIGLYTKIGFQKEGELREHVYKKNKYFDVDVMSILERDYVR